MEKINWKGGALLAPVPAALVTCGSMEHPNVLTIGWTGILATNPPKTYIAVRPERYSYGLIKESGVFTVNLTTRSLVHAADFCGVRSGRDHDKFLACGLTAVPGPETGCPMLAESPLSLECRVTDILPMGSHDLFLADIAAVQVATSLLDADGKLHLDRAGLIAYAHGEYFALGEKLGSFGYSVRKKPPKGRAKTPPVPKPETLQPNVKHASSSGKPTHPNKPKQGSSNQARKTPGKPAHAGGTKPFYTGKPGRDVRKGKPR